LFELQWIEFPEKRNKALLCYELPPPSLQGYGVSFMLHRGETPLYISDGSCAARRRQRLILFLATATVPKPHFRRGHRWRRNAGSGVPWT